MTAIMLEKENSDISPRVSILSGRYRSATVGIVLIVTLSAFEAMAVGTIMPVIARELDGLSLYAWAFSSFLIATLLANVVAGGWSDVSGPARPLLTGLTVFAVGLVLAGVAPSMWVFVAARVIQGLGAGTATVPLYVVIARVYPEDLRPRVFAALSAAWVVPSLIGPAIAGFVAEQLHWRLVFLGLIPLVVPAAVILIPSLRDSGGSGGPRPQAVRFVAALAVAIGAGALLYTVDHVTWSILPAAALGLALLAAGLPRLLPAGALRFRRGLPTVISVRMCLSGAFFGTEAFIPLALTSVHGFTPTAAGFVLTLGALGWSATAWYQGRTKHSGTALALAGTVLITAGVTGVAAGMPLTGWFGIPAWILAGAGMGLAYSSLSVLMLNLSTPADQGANSAALQIGDTLGGALGIGFAGALVTGLGTDRLELGLAAAGTLTAAIALLAVIAAPRVRGRHA
ncbi:MAG: MFS transporter [Actinomadura sp.]